jgi:hypothetical protein
MNNKLRQLLGNWYQGWISQAWNQVFSPGEQKFFSLEMEPSRAIQIYERQYTQQSRRWCYQRSSPMLTFPIDAVPISGKFAIRYFHPDTPEGTADVVPPPEHEEPPISRPPDQVLHSHTNGQKYHGSS